MPHWLRAAVVRWGPLLAFIVCFSGCGEKDRATQVADPGGSVDGSVGDAGSPDGLVGYTGLIRVITAPAGAATYSDAQAHFVASGDPYDCTTEPAGDGCWRSTCPKSQSDLTSAGIITLSGLSIGQLTLLPHGDKSYFAQDADLWWSGGETIRVGASGDSAGVAPFQVDVVAPRDLMAGATQWPTRTSDWTITAKWDAGVATPGTYVRIGIGDWLSDVWCVVPAETGSATLPGTLAAPLVTPDGYVYVQNMAWKRVGSVLVELFGTADDWLFDRWEPQ